MDLSKKYTFTVDGHLKLRSETVEMIEISFHPFVMKIHGKTVSKEWTFDNPSQLVCDKELGITRLNVYRGGVAECIYVQDPQPLTDWSKFTFQLKKEKKKKKLFKARSSKSSNSFSNPNRVTDTLGSNEPLTNTIRKVSTPVNLPRVKGFLGSSPKHSPQPSRAHTSPFRQKRVQQRSTGSKRARKLQQAGQKGDAALPPPKRQKILQQSHISPRTPPTSHPRNKPFGQARQTYLHRWFRPKATPTTSLWWKFDRKGTQKGFKNLGNTCYCNAVLRGLISLPSFTQALREKRFAHRILLDNSPYRAFLEILLEDMNPFHKVLSNARFKNIFNARLPAFDNYHQHDAHEFLTETLNILNEDMFDHMKKQDKDPKSLKDDDFPVKQNFFTEIETKMECTKCKYARKLRETFFALSLDLPKERRGSKASPYDPDREFCTKGHHRANFRLLSKRNKPGEKWYKCLVCAQDTSSKSSWGAKAVRRERKSQFTIQELLDTFLAPHTLHYSCEKCDSTSVTSSGKIVKLPSVLIFHIKRFTPNLQKQCYEKRLDPVAVEQMFNVRPFCSVNVRLPPAAGAGVERVVEESDLPPLEKSPSPELDLTVLEKAGVREKKEEELDGIPAEFGLDGAESAISAGGEKHEENAVDKENRAPAPKGRSKYFPLSHSNSATGKDDDEEGDTEVLDLEDDGISKWGDEDPAAGWGAVGADMYPSAGPPSPIRPLRELQNKADSDEEKEGSAMETDLTSGQFVNNPSFSQNSKYVCPYLPEELRGKLTDQQKLDIDTEFVNLEQQGMDSMVVIVKVTELAEEYATENEKRNKEGSKLEDKTWLNVHEDSLDEENVKDFFKSVQEMGLQFTQEQVRSAMYSVSKTSSSTDQDRFRGAVIDLLMQPPKAPPATLSISETKATEKEQLEAAINASIQDMGADQQLKLAMEASLNINDSSVSAVFEDPMGEPPKDIEEKEAKEEEVQPIKARSSLWEPCHLDQESCKYRLRSVVYHKGNKMFAGHYTCDVLSGKTFDRHDDEYVQEEVSVSKLEEKDRENGYIFFYARDDTL